MPNINPNYRILFTDKLPNDASWLGLPVREGSETYIKLQVKGELGEWTDVPFVYDDQTGE